MRLLRHCFVVVVDWTARGRGYKDWQLSIIVARSNFAVCQRYTFERGEWEEVIAASRRAKKVFFLPLSSSASAFFPVRLNVNLVA